MKIFIIQGALIGVIGTLVGVVGGMLIAWNVDVVVPAIEHLIGVQFLAKDVYYFSDLPSDPHWQDVIVIALTSFALSLAATLYPSLRAARVNPAEALRYE
jgi:lipoprotein-releasing system permease protein